MVSLMGQSNRIRRYQIALLIVLISLAVWITTRYFEMIHSEVEEFVFEASSKAIQRAVLAQTELNRQPNCKFLESTAFFETGLLSLPLANQPTKNSSILNWPKFKHIKNAEWHYFPQNKQLVYGIFSKRYFRSDIGSKVIINFICKNGNVETQISNYQWCKKRGIFYCKRF